MMEKLFSKTVIDEVELYIKNKELLNENDKVVCAVSGGADSVCMLHILLMLSKRHNYSVYAVHINHGIRQGDTDKDEEFVVDLCKMLAVELTIYRYDVPELSKQRGIGVEECARIARYEGFEQARRKFNADKIAIAHHSDDMVETFLFNLSRGSKLKGLCGIRSKRGNIIRPLLSINKDTIYKYIGENALDYVTDTTNFETKYSRNKIRNELIPYMTENINRQTVNHIRQTISDLNMLSEMVDEIIENKSRVLVLCRRNRYLKINKHELLKNNISMAAYILADLFEKNGFNKKDIRHKHYEALYGLCKIGTGKQLNLPNNILAKIEYDYLIITEYNDDFVSDKDNLIINIDLESLQDQASLLYNMNDYYIKCEISDAVEDIETLKINKDQSVEYFDFEYLRDKDLQLRYKRFDDYMIIDEQFTKKRLSRLFIDNKVPRAERENLPILVCNDRVLWVVGIRRSIEAKLQKTYTKALKITVIKNNK